MATNASNNVVIQVNEEEEVVYVLGNRTIESMPMFLRAISLEFDLQMGGEGPDDDASTHEIFLLNELRFGVCGAIDSDKVMELLKEPANHSRVMAALACLVDYDLSLPDAEDGLESDEEVAEFRRIWALLILRSLTSGDPETHSVSSN